MLTTSHHLQKSLDAGMEYFKLYFSAAFDRVSHSGLVFELKSVYCWRRCHAVWVCCPFAEFLADHRHTVVVDGATMQRVDPNRFRRVIGKCVWSSSVHPIYQLNV